MRITIEPNTRRAGFVAVKHGVYGRGSVLAGQASRSSIGFYATVEDAVAAHPNADVLQGSSKPFGLGGGSLADHSGLPATAPVWFDSSAAGERWDDDY